MAPSPGGFSRARVSNGDELRNEKKREICGTDGEACCTFPVPGKVNFLLPLEQYC